MAIKNYTTSINEEKTISEIEKILGSNGVKSVFKQYNGDGKVKSIAFTVMINDREIPFLLPMKEDKILNILKKSKKGTSRIKATEEQARMTGWRIIKDWIDAQMALIQIDLVKLEQVFLPYMYDMNNDITLFEKLEKKNFNLILEDKSNKEQI